MSAQDPRQDPARWEGLFRWATNLVVMVVVFSWTWHAPGNVDFASGLFGAVVIGLWVHGLGALAARLVARVRAYRTFPAQDAVGEGEE